MQLKINSMAYSESTLSFIVLCLCSIHNFKCKFSPLLRGFVGTGTISYNGAFLKDSYLCTILQFPIVFLSPSGILVVLKVPQKVYGFYIP